LRMQHQPHGVASCGMPWRAVLPHQSMSYDLVESGVPVMKQAGLC
jgi:hypothetical protein